MPSPPGDGPLSSPNYRFETFESGYWEGPQGFFVVTNNGIEYLYKTLEDLNNNNAYAYAELE